MLWFEFAMIGLPLTVRHQTSVRLAGEISPSLARVIPTAGGNNIPCGDGMRLYLILQGHRPTNKEVIVLLRRILLFEIDKRSYVYL